ncbi:hypothetical protein Scep_005001 [Stephania cephalantha]|uniref:Uncharacterized protein n=1 Tax=Stephania cephalantha TaxID=152367 RepID=A0AAP0KTG9_9MAGN
MDFMVCNCNIFGLFVGYSFSSLFWTSIQILLHNLVKIGISKLRDFHTEHRVEIVGLLEQEKAQFKSMHDLIGERVKQFVEKRLYACDLLQTEVKVDDIECRDVHITMDSNSSAVLEQEERHLLDRNLNVALQKKIKELQRNLRQRLATPTNLGPRLCCCCGNSEL